jgi:hypothetical protein
VETIIRRDVLYLDISFRLIVAADDGQLLDVKRAIFQFLDGCNERVLVKGSIGRESAAPGETGG